MMRRFAFLLIAAVFVGSLASASEAKVRKILQKRMSVEYEKAPLEDVFAEYAELTGLNVILGSDVDRKQPITIKVRQMSAGALLGWISKLAGVHPGFEKGALFIQKKATKRRGTIRVYNITDILHTPRSRRLTKGDDDDDDLDQMSREEKREKLLEIIRKIALNK